MAIFPQLSALLLT